MGPWQHLRRSAGLFRAAPLLSLALGTGLVLSLSSVCCGLGALAAPWFGCELFATQVGVATGARPPRTRAWAGAGLFLLGAVVIVSSAAWLATLGLGVDMPSFGGARPALDDVRTGLFALSGALLALVFIVPFLYAPIILVDRGGSLGGAVLESARFVIGGGLLGHLSLSVLSHVVQASPLLLAAALATSLGGRGEVPWALLAALPLLSVTLPLGQGMIVSAWLERRERLVEPGRTRADGRPGPALALALGAVLVAPALSLGLGAASLARPSHPRRGAAPAGEVLVDLEGPALRRRTLVTIPATALDLRIEDGWVSVEASDGGGAGRVPRPTAAPLEGLRVVRVRDAYAIEARAGGVPWVTWVNRAGVRLDDDLSARLGDRLPPLALLAIALALLLAPVTVGRALLRLAEVRRLAAEGATPEDTLAARRRSARRAGLWVVALTAPPMAAALAAAAHAAFG